MLELWIYRGSEYATGFEYVTVLNISEYAGICIYMPKIALIFYIVAGSIWFFFRFKLNILRYNFKFVVTCGGQVGQGPWILM